MENNVEKEIEKIHILQIGGGLMTNCMKSINVVFNEGIPSYYPKFDHDVSKITCEVCLNYIQKVQSGTDLKNVDNIAFEPLCIGTLNELKDKIYKEQFFDYDETVNPKKVLDELQNLKNNPKLLDYVIKCLNNQKISTIPIKFYAIVVNKEHIKPYEKEMWEKFYPNEPFEKWKEKCVVGNWDKRKEDILFPKVFSGIDEIEYFRTNIEEVKKEIPYFSTHDGNENILFEKFSIHEIG